MLTIKKDDFELLPSKISIARKYVKLLSFVLQYQPQVTNVEIYQQIEDAHIRIFGQNLPFPSYDAFRKYLTKYRKEIYRNT